MSLLYGYQSRKARYSTDPARMDRRVVLQAGTKTRDALGAEVITWSTTDTVWASKTFQSGRRLYAGEEKHGEDIVIFRIRYLATVQRFWRVVHGDDTYEIISVDELGRQHLMDLTCRAIDQSVASPT
jgi:SPP1 family predicted phage head-tail adaptor